MVTDRWGDVKWFFDVEEGGMEEEEFWKRLTSAVTDNTRARW